MLNSIPSSLKSKILDGRCVLFLGAGATKESGGCTGKELSDYIYRALGDTEVDNTASLAYYTQELVDHGYREDIERVIRERFKGIKPSDHFCKLTNIPWKAIYTTNYDDLVEKAYEKNRYYNCVVNTATALNPIYGDIDIPLYKINGDINTAFSSGHPLIITLQDLKDAKKTRKLLLQQLMKDLTDTFVFVGYSFSDQNEIVTELLDELSEDERWESVKDKYVIVPTLSKEASLLLKTYRIEPIYSKADEFFAYISSEAERDYTVKLRAQLRRFSNNPFLQNVDVTTKRYIVECFDFYEESEDYSVDGKFFFSGGFPQWGIIKNQYDIARAVKVIRNNPNLPAQDSITSTVYREILEVLSKNNQARFFINGPAASGKSTLIYRIAYDLSKHGQLNLIYKKQAKYKEGLITSIFDYVKEPFVISVDDIYVDISEIIKLSNEIEKSQLPIALIVASRNSDWSNLVGYYSKKALSHFDMTIEMKDTFTKEEAEPFVDKLHQCGLISFANSFEKKSLIKRITKTHNIVDALFLLTTNNKIEETIADEFGHLKPETRFAYSIISLVYRHSQKIRWEVLQRTISQSYDFSWERFVNDVLNCDAKGNFSEEEIQGSFYLEGRNRFISNLVVKIFFDGDYSKEIKALKDMIGACSMVEQDERFMCGLLNAILKDSQSNYSLDQLASLTDSALDLFINDYTKALINHMKGELYVRNNEYSLAIQCFEANVQSGLNEEYSLQSLGKTFFYKAKAESKQSPLFRLDIDRSIEKLLCGLKLYKTNEIYYLTLLLVFEYLKGAQRFSEENKEQEKVFLEIARKSIGEKRLEEIKVQLNNEKNDDEACI